MLSTILDVEDTTVKTNPCLHGVHNLVGGGRQMNR